MGVPMYRSRARRPATRRGLTLVELLVALVVTGLVIAAAHPAVGMVRDATERVRTAQAAARTAAAVRATLDGWLRGATSLDGAAPFVGVDRGDDLLPLDEVSFGVADAGVLRPGPHLIRLRVSRGPGSRTGLLAELAPIRNRLLGPVEAVELAPDAIGLSMRYHARIDGKDQWIDAWQADTILPRAIEARVVLGAAAAQDVVASAAGRANLLSVPLVVTFGWGTR